MAYARSFTLLALFPITALFAGCDLFGDDDTAHVAVVRYEGSELSAASAPAGWHVLERDGEQFTLTFTLEGIASGPVSPQTGDIQGLQPGQTIFLTLTDASGQLPTFHELWVGWVGGGGRVMKYGTIRIQDWDPKGVMSGVIDARISRKGPRGLGIAFWIGGEARRPE